VSFCGFKIRASVSAAKEKIIIFDINVVIAIERWEIKYLQNCTWPLKPR
jgi:hypothetical protein